MPSQAAAAFLGGFEGAREGPLFERHARGILARIDQVLYPAGAPTMRSIARGDSETAPHDAPGMA